MRFKSTLSLISILLPLIIITTAPPQAAAQVDEKEKAEKELAKRQELEKKALRLLDETVGAAWSLKLPENRFYVLTKAADLVWPHDEKRARSLFWEALNSLNLPGNQAVDGTAPKNPPANDTAKPSPTKTPTKEQAEALNQYYATLQTRREFLRKVAQRDPQLALDMLHASRPLLPRQIAGMFQSADDIDLEQEITYAAAANDPTRALQIAHESMAKGLTFQILSFLDQVLQKDEHAGSQLAGEIISKLNTENFNTSAAPYIAMQLLQLSRTGGAVLRASLSLDSSFKRLKLDDDQKQELVNMLTDAALSVTKPQDILLNIRFVMPEIEQYAPDRAAKLKVQIAEFDRTLPQAQRDWNNFNAMFENATPEEMIKSANKVAGDQRARLFYSAAAKAVARGETDRYRELINSQIENEDERTTALDSLNTEQMYYDFSQGKADDLEKLFPLIRAKEQRVMAMTQLAVMLEKKGQHDEAVTLLDDARALVKVDLTNEKESNALLAVMLGYSLVDSPKAFAMIEPIIDRTNEDVSKLVLLDKIVKSGAIKNGEIIMNQPRIPIDFAMLQYSPGVAALGKADFDRTRALADRFQRNELRIVARLLLAQAILRDLERTHSPNK
ncbi:MAG TPA: hypothetical protein VK557_05895 [Pyrinomonadaceae bacterium]|nr:hypothetical protein [Pyrinomonadaceae bacterium]